jgi:protease-4
LGRTFHRVNVFTFHEIQNEGKFMSSWLNLRSLGSLLIWGIAPLMIGWWLAQQVVPQPAVGIIHLQGDIWAGSLEVLQAQIDAARQDPAVRAVVLQLNSPGGEVVSSQEIYFAMQALRREIPVVATIDTVAASGGFWVVMAADPIYAKPSSFVGNVGAFSFFPNEQMVNDVILASGPFKLSAMDRDQVVRDVEVIKEEFLATVTSQRGQRMQITPTELSQGLIYQGRTAQRLGLIDHMGGRDEAIATAAEQAGITNYRVVDLLDEVLDQFTADAEPQARTWIGASDTVTGRRVLPPGIYLLYNVQLDEPQVSEPQ